MHASRVVALGAVLGVARAAPCKGYAEWDGGTYAVNKSGVISHVPTHKKAYYKGTGWYGGGGGTGKGDFYPFPLFCGTKNVGDWHSFGGRLGACEPPADAHEVKCTQSKGKVNCDEALTCSVVLDRLAKLEGGGYNCFGRHERTYWSQAAAEEACKSRGDCLDHITEAAQLAANNDPYLFTSGGVPSRYLSSWGYKSSQCQAEAFGSLGLRGNAEEFGSSPFPRCIDGMKHFADTEPVATSFSGLTEPLMYTGSLKENLIRKGFCTKESCDYNKEETYLYIYDLLRKLAGEPTASGKNRYYMTHGFNIKGAFGHALDEGYWVCLKPTDADVYGSSVPSKVHDYQVAAGKTASVDFAGVKKAEMGFMLSSEEFALMKKCSSDSVKNEAQTIGGVRNPATSMLLKLQDGVLAKVGASLAEADKVKYQKYLFVNINYGWRYAMNVHTPSRYVVYDSIMSAGDKRLAIANMIDAKGDTIADLDCNGPVIPEIKKCYDAMVDEGVSATDSCYWGGKDKATINYDTAFVSSTIYDKADMWKGNAQWCWDGDDDGYARAASCLVHKGKSTVGEVMTQLGCGADVKPPTCGTAKDAYQAGQCCGQPTTKYLAA